MNKKDYELQIRYKALFKTPQQIQHILEDHSDPFGAIDDKFRRDAYKYYPADDVYVEQMEAVLAGYPHLPVTVGPTQVVGHVWLGSQADAENVDALNRLNITHVLDLYGGRDVTEQAIAAPQYPRGCAVRSVRVFPCYDLPHYDILTEFPQAFLFMDRAKLEVGNVLVYSRGGQSCAGAVVLGYLLRCGVTLLAATRLLKAARGGPVITNAGFVRQLVTFARMRGLLEPNPPPLKQARQFGNAADLGRIRAEVDMKSTLYGAH